MRARPARGAGRRRLGHEHGPRLPARGVRADRRDRRGRPRALRRRGRSTRRTSATRPTELLAAVDEALEIGARARRAGRDLAPEGGRARATTATSRTRRGRIEAARGPRLDVHCDAYPYDAGQHVPEPGPAAVGPRRRRRRAGRAARGPRRSGAGSAHELETGCPAGRTCRRRPAAGTGSSSPASTGPTSRPPRAARVADCRSRRRRRIPLTWTLDLLVADRAAPVMIITMMDWARHRHGAGRSRRRASARTSWASRATRRASIRAATGRSRGSWAGSCASAACSRSNRRSTG